MTIDEFLEKVRRLRECGERCWRLDRGQYVRDDLCRCPLESVAGRVPPCPFASARDVGISDEDRNEIIVASDCPDNSLPLRQRLLQACGLKAGGI